MVGFRRLFSGLEVRLNGTDSCSKGEGGGGGGEEEESNQCDRVIKEIVRWCCERLNLYPSFYPCFEGKCPSWVRVDQRMLATVSAMAAVPSILPKS